MATATNLGFPRMGGRRELKKALERFWSNRADAGELESVAAMLRAEHRAFQRDAGIAHVPNNDFSFYDHVLDAAVICGAPWVEATLHQVEPSARIEWLVREGERCAADQVVLQVEGSARGLLTADRAALLAERELLQLVFEPGFSTAKEVTNVSGRGVGMDVVRTNVEKIGGKVEIDSRTGKGTTMRLRIPLTLAIIPALIVRSGKQSYALPQGALSELVHVSTDKFSSVIEWIDNAPLYRLRGMLLPLVFLEGLLNPAARARLTEQRNCFISVLDADGRAFGLVVDGLNDPEEIVVKPLSSVLKGIGLFSGATVLGNGELALILDPGAIAMKAGVMMISQEEGSQTQAEAATVDSESIDYLLVEIAGRRAAVQLSEVLRIEQVPLSRIEYVGYRPVLNFEGQLLPVEDSGGLLGAQENSEAPVIVVVCREGSRHVGIAVSQVLDVANGGDLFEAGTSSHASGVIALKERVTNVVDLGAVGSLPVNAESEAGEWSQMAEAVQ